MTVAELIAELQKLPPNTTVVLEYDGTWDTPRLSVEDKLDFDFWEENSRAESVNWTDTVLVLK